MILPSASTIEILIILYPSQPKRVPKINAVTLFTHHPFVHNLNIKDPTKRMMIIWIQDKEQAASPAMIALFLFSARTRCRLGNQIATIGTREEVETMREKRWTSLFFWYIDRALVAAISVAGERPMTRRGGGLTQT